LPLGPTHRSFVASVCAAGHPLEERTTDADDEIAPAEAAGVASPARHASGPEGTPGAGGSVSGGQRQTEGGEHVGHHLPPRLRAGARPHQRLERMAVRNSNYLFSHGECCVTEVSTDDNMQ